MIEYISNILITHPLCSFLQYDNPYLPNMDQNHGFLTDIPTFRFDHLQDLKYFSSCSKFSIYVHGIKSCLGNHKRNKRAIQKDERQGIIKGGSVS